MFIQTSIWVISNLIERNDKKADNFEDNTVKTRELFCLF